MTNITGSVHREIETYRRSRALPSPSALPPPPESPRTSGCCTQFAPSCDAGCLLTDSGAHVMYVYSHRKRHNGANCCLHIGEGDKVATYIHFTLPCVLMVWAFLLFPVALAIYSYVHSVPIVSCVFYKQECTHKMCICMYMLQGEKLAELLQQCSEWVHMLK